MKWHKWELDNLPPVKEVVLVAFKSGVWGPIEFFPNEIIKEAYVIGLKNGCENLEDIELIMQYYNDDPPIAWAKCPMPPKEFYVN